jgi:hypothetical protein
VLQAQTGKQRKKTKIQLNRTPMMGITTLQRTKKKTKRLRMRLKWMETGMAMLT